MIEYRNSDDRYICSALPKQPINQFKPVQQQVLRSYCPNIYIYSHQRVMILGGDHNDNKEVWIFDPNEYSFTKQPSLLYHRVHFACTIFTSPKHNFRPVVLAAGGWTQERAEIWDYTVASSSWVESNYIQNF